MYIAVIQDEEVEDEINIESCCRDCTVQAYAWSEKQYQYVFALIKEEKPVPVPAEVTSAREFGIYIKSMKL